MNEKKHERFVRVATQRVNQLIADFEKLGNCASKVSYDYTDAEVEQIFKELDTQMATLRDQFAGKRAFSLSDKN